MTLKNCIVLLSGGQDSTTCLYWAKNHFENVEALGFDYGQKHKLELTQAALIAKKAAVPFHTIDIKGVLSGSSLTDHSKDHNEKHARNENLPNSFTAGRNILFLTIAGGRAFNKGIHHIVGGMCQTDYSGYPDCRRTFIDSMQSSLYRGLNFPITIHTPLMWLTKAQTWRLAKELGCLDVIINDTMTDYNGDTTKNEWGYGKLDNPASKLRAKGYFEAKEKNWI